MSEIDDIRELQGDLQRHLAVGNDLLSLLDSMLADDVPKIGRGRTAAFAIAGLIETYYTNIETVLVRIAQRFGNSLSAQRWHADLLQRMATAVPQVRPAVLSNRTLQLLDELMRFRHFKRYYYQSDFDWGRLDRLIEVIQQLHPSVCTELQAFDTFLNELLREP